MKNSFKNTFLLDKKYLSLGGVSEKWKIITFTSQSQKYHFPSAEIGFILKKLLPMNFKFFSKTLLNKTILFLPDRKFVSTSWNEEFVKKTFPFDGETVFTAWNI